MKLIKLGAISFIVLFSIITFIGLLLPSKVIVSRATEIAAPVDSVFSIANNFIGWQNWVDGFSTQKNITTTSAYIGKSKISIVEKTKSSIAGNWIESNGNTQEFSLQVLPLNNSKSLVQWQFQERVAWYPWARLGSLVNDKVIGATLEKNLANLKKIMEQKR